LKGKKSPFSRSVGGVFKRALCKESEGGGGGLLGNITQKPNEDIKKGDGVLLGKEDFRRGPRSVP